MNYNLLDKNYDSIRHNLGNLKVVSINEILKDKVPPEHIPKVIQQIKLQIEHLTETLKSELKRLEKNL